MILGITGGIGSGKTIICRIFRILKVPVFSADDEARKIMETSGEIIRQITHIAGEHIYNNGILQRKELATIIFSNPEILKKVNETVHPEVFRRFSGWVNEQHHPYVIMEAAILFESGADKLVDKILTVTAPEEERIRRVTSRNMISEEEVVERIRNQFDDNFRIKRSDFVIDNPGNKLIIPEVLKIHEEMMLLSAIKTGN